MSKTKSANVKHGGSRRPAARPKPASPAARRLLWRGLVMLAMSGLIVFILIGWGTWLWHEVGPEVVASRDYRLDPHAISVVPVPPAWIHVDVREQVLSGSEWNEPRSMLDERLPSFIADAFELHPWVRHAKVELSYPAKVRVELEYRQPVASFLVTTRAGDERLVLDAAGNRLPEKDLSLTEIAALPQIDAVSGVHVPLVGQRVEEIRMRGAAEIADLLIADWKQLGFQRIVPLPVLEGAGEQRFPVYELRSDDGRAVIWGAAPSAAPDGEPLASEKLRHLKALASQMRHDEQGPTSGRYDLRQARP